MDTDLKKLTLSKNQKIRCNQLSRHLHLMSSLEKLYDETKRILYDEMLSEYTQDLLQFESIYLEDQGLRKLISEDLVMIDDELDIPCDGRIVRLFNFYLDEPFEIDLDE